MDGTAFGDVPSSGSALNHTFKLRNEGELPRQYISASLSNNTDFAISNLPVPSTYLAGDPTGFKNFTITFDPVSTGVKSSVLEIEPASTIPPLIESFVIPGNGGCVEIMGTSGKTYRLTTSTTLTNDWVIVPGTSPVVANGSSQSINSTIDPVGDPKRFYRLEEGP